MQRKDALEAAARCLFWAICPLRSGCLKLIAHTLHLGNLCFIPLANLLMKILTTNNPGQTSVEVLDAYFHFNDESLITSLCMNFQLVLYTLDGNFSSMIFPLLIYENVVRCCQEPN